VVRTTDLTSVRARPTASSATLGYRASSSHLPSRNIYGLRAQRATDARITLLPTSRILDLGTLVYLAEHYAPSRLTTLALLRRDYSAFYYTAPAYGIHYRRNTTTADGLHTTQHGDTCLGTISPRRRAVWCGLPSAAYCSTAARAFAVLAWTADYRQHRRYAFIELQAL